MKTTKKQSIKTHRVKEGIYTRLGYSIWFRPKTGPAYEVAVAGADNLDKVWSEILRER